MNCIPVVCILVRIDQIKYELTKIGYEFTMTWVRIDQMSTNWPIFLSTNWLEYELTRSRLYTAPNLIAHIIAF